MSNWVAIDNPGIDVDWFADYPESERSRRPVGPCPHDCDHWHQAIVAWGADLAHYELVVCRAECGGDCRGWLPADSNREGGTYGPTRREAVRDPKTWRLLGPTAARSQNVPDMSTRNAILDS